MKKVVFLPGNGNCTTSDNWFPFVKNALEKEGIKVVAEKFPDPELARASYWLPFMKDTLSIDENSILIGHSSGAIAAMRYAEQNKILGSILVGAYYTHLNMETEKQSEYFDTPWNWDAIKQNQKWTILFASQNDPWIPVDEPRYIHNQLQCEYHEFKDQGHFGGDYFKETFPELVVALLRYLKS